MQKYYRTAFTNCEDMKKRTVMQQSKTQNAGNRQLAYMKRRYALRSRKPTTAKSTAHTHTSNFSVKCGKVNFYLTSKLEINCNLSQTDQVKFHALKG